MAKFYGSIGYSIYEEVRDGVWEPKIIERSYYGDLIKNFKRTESSGNLNDNINISNEISIVSDPFADQNFHSMIYVEYRGVKWKVTNVDVQFPRLILSIGGVYNGE